MIIIILLLSLCGISNRTSLTKSSFCIYKFNSLYWFLLTSYLWICEMQVTLSGDVELNPGSKLNSGRNLSVCPWNMNNIPAHSFPKISLLSTRNSLDKLDVICLPETYLYFSILLNTNLEMQGIS